MCTSQALVRASVSWSHPSLCATYRGHSEQVPSQIYTVMEVNTRAAGTHRVTQGPHTHQVGFTSPPAHATPHFGIAHCERQRSQNIRQVDECLPGRSMASTHVIRGLSDTKLWAKTGHTQRAAKQRVKNKHKYRADLSQCHTSGLGPRQATRTNALHTETSEPDTG